MSVNNEHKIGQYFHCGLCLEELPGDQSPRDFASLEAGWTKLGLQVWCKRHDVNIVSIDFEGQTHPVDTSRPV